MSQVTKVTEKDLLKTEDKTDWNKVITESQDIADIKANQDSENPVFPTNKFVKSDRS